jgi:hypothetical protein
MEEAQVQEVLRRTGERYGELYAERRRYSERALRQHLEERILPGIALYQVLLEDVGAREAAMEIVDEVFWEWGISSRRAPERAGRLPLFYWLIRFMMKPMMRWGFPEQGWETEWVEVSGDVIAFDISRCFYLDVLEQYGVPELTAQYCRLDDLIAEDLSPYVRWNRRRTLGRGDECCDFRFERVKREERG